MATPQPTRARRVLPPVYDEIGQFEDGMRVAALLKDGLWGLFNAHGNDAAQAQQLRQARQPGHFERKQT